MSMTMSSVEERNPLGFHIAPDDAQVIRRLRSWVICGQVDYNFKSFPVVYQDLYSAEPWKLLKDEDPAWEITKDHRENKSSRTIYVITPLKPAVSESKKRAPSDKQRFLRSAGTGSWHGGSGEQPVLSSDHGGSVIGTTSYFNFRPKQISSQNNTFGEWSMHEYRLHKESLKGLSFESISRARDLAICKITHVVDKNLKIHCSWPKTPVDLLIEDFKSQGYFRRR